MNKDNKGITNGIWHIAKNGNQWDIYSKDARANRNWTVATNLTKEDAYFILACVQDKLGYPTSNQ